MKIKVGQVRRIRYARDKGEYVASFLLNEVPAKLHASQIIPVRNGDWLAMEGNLRDGVFAGRNAYNKTTGAVCRASSVDDVVAALVIAVLAAGGLFAGLPNFVGLAVPASLIIGLYRWLAPRAATRKLAMINLPSKAKAITRAFVVPAGPLQVDRRLK
ncbi:hypothetical protein E4L96_20080 [Massilia arenosa]|uniref:Uncharacterized protein n=1 Tax=Zemynaea arenosa TaxID=2561931 RepID=A0A4Y9RVS4_9BURK|nr:hypothetical protein [Massilia arenosa]TFW13397.1 hypothetical protein E4L96_20080 [Massilia arenosa]